MGIYRQIEREIIENHPDYVEVYNLASIAAKTWPRFGLSIKDISQMDDYTLSLIRTLI